MRFLFSLFLFVFSILSANLVAQQGVPSDWQQQDYAYYANDAFVAQVLDDFSTQLVVPVEVTARASEVTVSGVYSKGNSLAFLDKLLKPNNLVWFYNGAVIYVGHISEVQSVELILGKDFKLNEFKKNYQASNIKGSFIKWEVILNDTMMRVSGLSQYYDLIRRIINHVNGISVDKHKQPQYFGNSEKITLHTIDVLYAYQKQDLEQMAVLLSQLFQIPFISLQKNTPIKKQDSNKKTNSSKAGGSVNSLMGLFSSGLSAKNVEPHDQEDGATSQNKVAPKAKPKENDLHVSQQQFITVNYDQRKIIVSDKGYLIPRYEAVVKQLDIPVEQVEISVSVLDVNSDYSSELGINYQNNQENGLIDFTYSSSTIHDFSTFRATAIALVDKGEARFVSEPSVLTLNNREAVFTSNQTFYVRLAGDRAVDLIPIQFGTSLKVTPLVLSPETNDADALRRIYLNIAIEDGVRDSASNNSAVDNIPALNNTNIVTEAILEDGYSLIVGGYKINSNSKSRSGLPILSKIPYLGYLFSTKSKTFRETSRYIIITSKIIESNYNVRAKQVIKQFKQGLK